LIIPPDRVDEERSILERLRRGQHIDHLETERITKDGRRIDISLTVSPVKDEQGHLIGASKVARDITERKRARQALQESEAKLNAIVEQLPIGVMVTDETGRILSLNAAGKRIHGVDPLEDLRVTLDDYLARYELRDTDGTPVPLEHLPIAQALRGDYVSDRELVLRRPDGEQRFVLSSTVAIRGADEANLLLFMIQDITNRRRAEQALAASRAQLRLVTDHAAVMLSHCDPDSRYLFVNRTYAERFGLDAEQLVGRRIADVIGPAAYAVLETHVTRVLQGELVEFEAQMMKPSIEASDSSLSRSGTNGACAISA
jgi:PAS domain S-box-containing protein